MSKVSKAGHKRVGHIGFMLTFLTLLSLTGCQLPVTAPVKKVPPQWLEAWINTTDNACAVPCFHGINPGKTSVHDVKLLLQNQPFVKEVYDVSFDSVTDTRQIEWSYEDSGDGISFSEKGSDTINEVRISASLSSNDHYGISLDHITHKLGAPGHVLINECQFNTCSVSVIYIDQGVILDFIAKAEYDFYDRRSVSISPDQSIDVITFFPAGQSSFNSVIAHDIPGVIESLIIWKGYGEYP